MMSFPLPLLPVQVGRLGFSVVCSDGFTKRQVISSCMMPPFLGLLLLLCVDRSDNAARIQEVSALSFQVWRYLIYEVPSPLMVHILWGHCHILVFYIHYGCVCDRDHPFLNRDLEIALAWASLLLCRRPYGLYQRRYLLFSLLFLLLRLYSFIFLLWVMR